jgi:hypothetical protein
LLVRLKEKQTTTNKPSMSQKKKKRAKTQIEVIMRQTGGSYTKCAGVLALWRLWQRLDVASLLAEAEISYGKEENKASSLSFAKTVGPLVGAASDRRIAQRFGGEASPEGIEKDALLSQMVKHHFDQRTLNRFVAQERHQWRRFHQARVRWLQRQPELKAAAEGVVILDDWPIAKPYAEAMESLSQIRDQNQNRYVSGFQVVHLYYHHPQRPDYSLYVEPWKETSKTGETNVKPSGAYRPAHENEERSRLDIALDAVRDFVPLLADYQAVVFDSWYTARWLGHALTESDVRWIGVAESSQKFELAQTGEYLAVPDILERFWDQCQAVATPEPALAVAIPALIRPDFHTKVAQPVQLVLTRGKDSALDDDEPDYYLLICNQLEWSAPKIATLFSYRSQIEPAHRQGKQLEGWVDFQYQRWSCFLAHLAFSWLRSLLLLLLQLWHEGLATFSVRELIQHFIQSVASLSQRSETLVVYLARGQPAVQHYFSSFPSCDYSFVKVL